MGAPHQLNRENSFPVIADMQHELCKPGGKLYTETSAKIVPGVISAIRELAEQARLNVRYYRRF